MQQRWLKWSTQIGVVAGVVNAQQDYRVDLLLRVLEQEQAEAIADGKLGFRLHLAGTGY